MNELPIRKNIRLRNYDYSANGAYFLTICTQNRVHLFGEVDAVGDALCGIPQFCPNPNGSSEMLVKWINEIHHKFIDTEVSKYIIMPNHIHFLTIKGGRTGPPLHEVISWFKTMTTNDYIRGVKSGKYPRFDKRIWQRNYYEHVIRNEEDYRRHWQYIDQNPARWPDDIYFSQNNINNL
jgi:REP element-mobilizing transposase RayT